MCVCLSGHLFCTRALIVKMCRLWATTCQDVSSLGRGALCVCVCVLVWASVLYASPSCQDVSSLGNNLSRCIVFRQGGSVCVCVYLSGHLFCTRALVVKMCRLWATTCQDVSSLGRGALCVCVCICLGICSVCEP